MDGDRPGSVDLGRVAMGVVFLAGPQVRPSAAVSSEAYDAGRKAKSRQRGWSAVLFKLETASSQTRFAVGPNSRDSEAARTTITAWLHIILA